MASLTTRFLLLLCALAPALPSTARAQSAAPRAGSTPQFPVTLTQAADKAAAAARPTDAQEPGWSAPEIAEGQTICNASIARHKAVARLLPPIHEGECGTPVPIEVTRIGAITLSHPTIINCHLLGTLDAWLQGDVQPAARKHLGGPVVQIGVMSSYSCRNAYGRKRTNLSEHALANAIDIGGFRTTSGGEAVVLADWGMTEREIKRKMAAAETAAKRLQQAKIEAEARATAETAAKTRATAPQVAHAAPIAHATKNPVDETVTGSAASDAPTLKGLIADTFGKAAFRSIGQGETSSALGLDQPSKLGGPKVRQPGDAPGAKEGTRAVSAEARTAFLHEIHALACKRFGTVLGPEANYDHRNHFHLDLAERPNARYKHFCE